MTPAPLKNQNAVKPDADRASSFLHVRVTPFEKAGWVRAAKRNQCKLAQWVTLALNQRAARDNQEASR